MNDDTRAKVDATIADAKKAEPEAWRGAGVEKEVRAALLDPVRAIGLACHTFARGAWALEPKTIQPLPNAKSASIELSVVLYVGTSRYVAEETINAGEAAMFIEVRSQLASDYDGDGIPEFYVRITEDGVEGGHGEDANVFTFDGTTVKLYAPATTLGVIGEPIDVDGDGLLDLPASQNISLGEGIECEGKADWKPAKLLAHAKKDGLFSLDDAVARSYVRSWCAAAPTSVANPEQALCARIWKQPRTMVTSSCGVWDCALEAAGKPQAKRATRDCQDRIDAYNATVPFTLP